jgi:nucleoside-diphosphate-sugar epimerase
MKTKILLTGASGAVGFQTFQELLTRNDRIFIRIFSLDTPVERKIFLPYENQAEVVWGDIRNISDVIKAVQDIDIVLHIAGIIPPEADHNHELARGVNVLGTRNLVNAMLQQTKIPDILFTSSISVYGDRLDDPYITVSDPIKPSLGDFYAQTKIDAENIIKASGLRWAIFRLCGILVDRLQIQPLMFHMPLDTALEWCHVEDAGYGLARAVTETSIFGNVYNFGGGENCRIVARNFLDRMLPLWGLNSEVLPDFAFATRNFHSGYYQDGDRLNNVLQFQRKTLSDYFDSMKMKVSPIKRQFIRCIPQSFVRQWLLRMSEPLRAIRENNETLIQRFYGSREIFNRLLQKEMVSA